MKTVQPSILSFVRDLPNLCSLAGLVSAVLAIYFALLGLFPAAMIGLIWAVFFDWSDGQIARRMSGRSETSKQFGGQLDSLIDIVSFGVCPAIVLLSYGDFNGWYLPGAIIIVAAGALRLSHYNVFGLQVGASYQGLAIDNNGIILALLFVIEPLFDNSTFATLLYILIVVLAALNVAPIKTPKLSGNWYYGITVGVVALTAVFSLQLLK